MSARNSFGRIRLAAKSLDSEYSSMSQEYFVDQGGTANVSLAPPLELSDGDRYRFCIQKLEDESVLSVVVRAEASLSGAASTA